MSFVANIAERVIDLVVIKLHVSFIQRDFGSSLRTGRRQLVH